LQENALEHPKKKQDWKRNIKTLAMKSLARHAILLSQWNEQKGTCPRSARSGSVGPCHICRWEEEGYDLALGEIDRPEIILQFYFIARKDYSDPANGWRFLSNEWVEQSRAEQKQIVRDCSRTFSAFFFPSKQILRVAPVHTCRRNRAPPKKPHHVD
jgi:hypothetical protein